jgi:cytochrome c-type biogenesis protein CcmF
LETQFIGEHLWPGQLGHFFVITAFVGALMSAFCYWRAVIHESKDLVASSAWIKLGRGSFVFHTLSIIGIFSMLYYIITHHLFEYNYAFQHSSKALPMKYLLSCFWEGQEGSFMLWAFWHSILGLIVMLTSKQLESRTMTVIALVQVAIATMLLGFYFGEDVKVGTTPFILLRHVMQDAPIFQQAGYLNMIQDGNGLNILLQNYWMVIHPPVLFLGFASTLIPFAYTIAALWKGDYQLWLKPTWVWSLFAGAVLGTGIMMGGAWAYESLTFGGYWAWDPVENASLVPWLTLIAGLHTLIVFKATQRSLPFTLILFILTYWLVWYSTFLTRTGVLGNTSVHAFTGEGKPLYWHLVLVLSVLLLSGLVLLVYRWKKLPRVEGEEPVATREFWMFIGSFVLLLSAVQITISTSIPVWSPLAKWITGKDIAPPVEPVKHYNNIQVWVAILVACMTGAVLYLKFKKTDVATAIRKLLKIVLVSLILSSLIAFFEKINAWQYALLLFASVFAITAMLNYAFVIQKQLKKMGPAISHLGFALVLLGILLSSFKKEVISLNTIGAMIDFGKKTAEENAKESQENVVLYKNTPAVIGEYWATYLGDSTSSSDPRTFYKVQYEKKDSATGKTLESFVLYPDAFVNPKGQMGLTPNPASKHYFTKDIFTYVTSVPDPDQKNAANDFKAHEVKMSDTVFLNKGYLVFHNFEKAEVKDSTNVSVKANLTVHDLKGVVGELHPSFSIKNNAIESEGTERLSSMNLELKFTNIFPQKNAIELQVKEGDDKKDYIVMKALLFPFINVLWLGIVVMVFGFFVSMWNRITKKI